MRLAAVAAVAAIATITTIAAIGVVRPSYRDSVAFLGDTVFRRDLNCDRVIPNVQRRCIRLPAHDGRTIHRHRSRGVRSRWSNVDARHFITYACRVARCRHAECRR
ncbi:hypothetical protein D3C81_1890590 [compost metagenome]